jgi:hypothetical protein
MLLYDDKAHAYSDGWATVPSVTQVLSSYFGTDPRWYAPGSAERGTLAHELCAAYYGGDYSATRNGYAKAFAQWGFDSGARVLEMESMIEGCINGRRYAGRFDLIAEVDGRRVLVDLKTGAKAKWHHAQIAAYSLVAKPARGMVLYLSEDGTYKPDWLTAAQLLEGSKLFARALEAWKGKK